MASFRFPTAFVAALGLLAVLIPAAAQQQVRVYGTVSDAITGETLLQAAVVVNGKGTMTDFDGNYSLSLPSGKHTLKVSYVGYTPMEKVVEVSTGDRRVDFKLETLVLQEAQVVADVAIERSTPVAFSNIKPIAIQEQLGSQPIPMILNTTPGVFATATGSENDGPSVTIRGFKQRNVSVMLDGIPVNDMENGGVFWNNWFGLDLVTSTMQVQRGLGASKLALPAIGGTVNIVTQGIESARRTNVKQEVGSFGFTRTSLSHTTGRLPGGWGLTFSGSYQDRGGYFEQDYNRSWFYYGKVQKELGNHSLSLSAMGAPTRNASRSYRQRIVTHDRDYARGLFNGSDEEYATMSAYSQAHSDIFNNGSLTAAQEADAIAALNEEYGYGSVEDFEAQMSATDFVDTARVVDYGIGYNVHWGMLNGEVQHERENMYHKPLFTFRHNWRISERFYLSNTVYASYGKGGGTRLENPLGAGDYTADGHVDFDKFYYSNTVGNIFGPPIDPLYSDSLYKSGRILRKLHNEHEWYGVLSTFRWEASEAVTVSGGLDARTYRGGHFATVYDLLGGDYFVDANDANATTKMRFEGDTIGYHNDAFVRWGGAFGLVEYKGYLYNLFLNVSAVSQGYNRVDYFLPVDSTGSYAFTGWKWIPGYTVKAGGNYNLSEHSNAFMNVGYLNRTPVFQNVVDFTNNFVLNTQNEKIASIEVGYSFSKFPWTVNVNGYYTDWNNRPLDVLLRFETPTGEIVRANVNSMSAVHRGLEADAAWELGRNLTLEGYVSLGDWEWESSEDSLKLIDDDTNTPYLDADGEPVTITYDAKGVAVGDAPQNQYSISLRYEWNRFYIRPRYTFFDRYYADFDPFSLYGANAGRQSWELPEYGLLDIHAGWSTDFRETNLEFRLSLFNVLNTVYLGSAQNNDAYGQVYYNDPARRYALTTNNFDAASAAVYMGLPFRSNFSVRVRF